MDSSGVKVHYRDSCEELSEGRPQGRQDEFKSELRFSRVSEK